MIWIATAAVIVALTVWLVILLVRARRTRQRFRILSEVADISDSGGSLEETFSAICDILVPQWADFCTIDVVTAGRVRRAAARVTPKGGPEAERRLAECRPSFPWLTVEGEDADSLAPRLFERVSENDLPELAHDPKDLEFIRSLGIRSAITVVLKARGRVTGALTVGTAWSGRRYGPDDARFVWILSGRVALALDNSGLFANFERAERARSEIAKTLQQGLLPLPLPHIPGWSIAAMYRPAGAENEVGGDFYDAFRVPRGWMLVIGDVTGRGARAASITAQARYTLRTAAVLTGDPLVSLMTLNRALRARGDGALCSLAVLGLSEDSAQPIQLAVAGHLPPLLVDGDSVTEASRSDPVLGAFDHVEWQLRLSSLEAGQQLVIVTDGIVDAKGPEGRFGEDRLRAELMGATRPALTVQRLEGALHSFTKGALDDDAAILAVARTSRPWPEDASAGPATTAVGVGEPG